MVHLCMGNEDRKTELLFKQANEEISVIIERQEENSKLIVEGMQNTLSLIELR